MKTSVVREKYTSFYARQNHAVIPGVSLIPENDPTTLFTSSGMQPLVPYLLGEAHPSGRRLTNSQPSFRSQDIEEVGDNRHTTFFEMLGNWSLGDYFKREQLPWIFSVFTRELGLDPKRLYVSIFEGNESVPADDDSAAIWKEIYSQAGIEAREGERIFRYSARKNWWSRSGEPKNMPPGEPGGPDSEVFYEFVNIPHDPAFGPRCHPNCDCGRFLEIGNSVFMQYRKTAEGTLVELPQKNVDFGGGLERIVAALADEPDIFRIDTMQPLIQLLEESSGKKYGEDQAATRAMRIVTDHIRAATMLIRDGAPPSNKQQGYVVRRLIRRAIRFGRILGVKEGFTSSLGETVLNTYGDYYPTGAEARDAIKKALQTEESKFNAMIGKGLKEIDKLQTLTGAAAFKIFETYGFPWEMTEEIARERGQQIDREEFQAEFRRHQELSRTAAKGSFKSGLSDTSEQVTRLHTATHLLHQALRTVLGAHVQQKGSNITAERLRFDFSHPAKVTPEELKKVEALVIEQVQKDLPVSFKVSTFQEAVNEGALAFFGERYPEKVKVYSMGDFSKEICAGPHVEKTGALSGFKIIKEEASAGRPAA